jgi:hypothetical protein
MEQKLAEGLVDALHAAGVNFITYLPETRLSEIIPSCKAIPPFKWFRWAAKRKECQ